MVTTSRAICVTIANRTAYYNKVTVTREREKLFIYLHIVQRPFLPKEMDTVATGRLDAHQPWLMIRLLKLKY